MPWGVFTGLCPPRSGHQPLRQRLATDPRLTSGGPLPHGASVSQARLQLRSGLAGQDHTPGGRRGVGWVGQATQGPGSWPRAWASSESLRGHPPQPSRGVPDSHAWPRGRSPQPDAGWACGGGQRHQEAITSCPLQPSAEPCVPASSSLSLQGSSPPWIFLFTAPQRLPLTWLYWAGSRRVVRLF